MSNARIEDLGDLFISLSGIIGSGKTTLATALAKVIRVPVYHESAQDSSLLAKFYEDMPGYAFLLQLDLLQHRVKQQQSIAWADSGCVQDRTIYEDAVFVHMLHKQGLLSNDQVKVYHDLFRAFSKSMVRPSVIIHLDVSPEEALRRVRERNRPIESSLTLEYLSKLSAAYEEFLQRNRYGVHTLRIKWESYESVELVARRIAQALEEQNFVTVVEL